MAPAVILIGCLLATMSCSTTAQSTTPPTTDQANTAAVLTTDTTTTTTSITSLPATTPPASTTSTTPPAPTTTTATTPPSTPPTTTTTPPSPTPTTVPSSTPLTTTTTPLRPASTRIETDTSTVHPPTLTSYPSNVTSIPVTTRPGVSNATTIHAPVYGSCGNPDLCCSGKNNSCHRLNCFCDVACLRLHDCCPDFKHTCLTVNNSTNSTKPNSTLPLTGTCSEPTLCCNGLNFDCFRGCFCDEACQEFNDCCPDLNSTCIFNTTADPPFDPTADPPFHSTADRPFTSTAALPKDVPTILTVLEARVLTKSFSSEEERQAVMRQVGALLGSLLGVNNTDIISLKVIRFQPVSPYD